MSPTSDYAAYLHTVYMFLINETSMIPAHGLATIVKMLQGITGGPEVFGGTIFLLGGNFRQVLLLVP